MPAVGKRKKAAFIKAIQSGQTVAAALRLVRVRREDIYAARFDDTAFKAAWDEAWTMGADALEDEAMRRAIDGVEKPVFRGGEVVGHVRDYSDSMLMFLLKSRKPDVFGGKGGVDTVESGVDFESEIEDAKATLKSKLCKITQSPKKSGVS
jgi:hypothetical protein